MRRERPWEEEDVRALCCGERTIPEGVTEDSDHSKEARPWRGTNEMSVNGRRQKAQFQRVTWLRLNSVEELKLLCWAYEMKHHWNRLISEAIWIVQRDQFARFLLSLVCCRLSSGDRAMALDAQCRRPSTD